LKSIETTIAITLVSQKDELEQRTKLNSKFLSQLTSQYHDFLRYFEINQMTTIMQSQH